VVRREGVPLDTDPGFVGTLSGLFRQALQRDEEFINGGALVLRHVCGVR
jgi:hypothetical protein